jgi:uroporphyrinogen-III decarboxylase
MTTSKQLFAPAIYEHKAKLIDKTPFAVSRDADLLFAAICREVEIYHSDFLTVGMDIYNLELEAMGIPVIDRGNECPELADIPPGFTPHADIFANGRFAMMLEVGKRLRQITATPVRIAATGPITLTAKLIGIENLLIDLITGEGEYRQLLETMTEVTAQWCAMINNHQLDTIIFDSMAAPPLFSPELYRQHAFPLHRQLMTEMANRGQQQRELVIGGDTAPIAADLKASGANILLCDFIADGAEWRHALGDASGIQVRCNINPSELTIPPRPDVITEFIQKLQLFDNVIAGTGILPYAFAPAGYLAWRDAIRQARM